MFTAQTQYAPGTYAQNLYSTPTEAPQYNCSWNVGGGAGGCCGSGGTYVAYLSCDVGTDCGSLGCDADNGGGCAYIAGNDCTTSSCHPTYCSGAGDLGGCPDGSGSQDDCGGVSCEPCSGTGGAGSGTGYGSGGGEIIAYCGDDTCNSNEQCWTCPQDCGACPPPVTCPNAVCDAGEHCANCPADCGACATPTPTPTPIPNSTITVNGGSIVSSSSPTCAEVFASTSYIANTIMLIPGGVPQSVAPGGSATWLMRSGTYTVRESPPAGYVLQQACWVKSGVGPSTQGSGLTEGVLANQTITWTLGYSDAVGWTQVSGGDAYAATSIASYISAGASPQYFSLDGSGGTPGFVTYGGSYDFDASVGSLGGGNISSTGWNANESYTTVDWYASMYQRFDSPTTEDYAPGSTIARKSQGQARTGLILSVV